MGDFHGSFETQSVITQAIPTYGIPSTSPCTMLIAPARAACHEVSRMPPSPLPRRTGSGMTE